MEPTWKGAPSLWPARLSFWLTLAKFAGIFGHNGCLCRERDLGRRQGRLRHFGVTALPPYRLTAFVWLQELS